MVEDDVDEAWTAGAEYGDRRMRGSRVEAHEITDPRHHPALVLDILLDPERALHLSPRS